jgi:diacylglycerol O-acyltransferase / wax synthase
MNAGRIPPLDLMFYLTETSESPKHVGAVQIFQMPANAPKNFMRNLVVSFKAAPVLPPFNYRPSFPRFGMPQWQVDDRLDIDYHVRHSALPAPGTERQLREVLQRLHCGLLNRDRPGWICQIIEGLEGNRFAIYYKIHHAYIDGMSGVKRVYGTLSPSAKTRKIVPSWSYQMSAKSPAKKADRPRQLNEAIQGVAAQLSAGAQLSTSFARMGLEMFGLESGSTQVPFRAPRTRMNDRVECDTRSIAFCSLPLDRALSIAHKLEGKFNDVVLAIIDAALQDYLSDKGEKINSPLVAYCPMSVRSEHDDRATTQATALTIRMGAPEANIRDRLLQVIESSTATKKEASKLSREALMDLAMVMIGVLELADRSRLSSVISPSYNVLVSNVPGPKDDALYLRGSKLQATYPISAFLPGVNINVTLVTAGNQIDFGLVADKQALPDLDQIAERMQYYFSELEREVLGKKRASRKRRRR